MKMKTNPVILITGAGKGIGEATVSEIIKRKDAFAAQGGLPRLLLTSRTQSDLERLQLECKSAGIESEILATELSAHPKLPVQSTLQKWGRVDILIHNAGVGRFTDFLDQTEDDLSFTINTNVNAAFLLMQTTYSQMKKQKSGHILFVTSVAAEKPFKQSSIYCMSKYAQKGLIDVMRLYAYEDGIKITDVQPGAVFTPMWGEVPTEMSDVMLQPTDVAKAMLDAIFSSPHTSIEEIRIRPVQGDFP